MLSYYGVYKSEEREGLRERIYVHTQASACICIDTFFTLQFVL